MRKGRVILHDVSLVLPSAAVTAIVGPSGAGKSTLLRLLNRLDEPSTGDITLGGCPLGRHDVRALRRRVGLVFQVPVLFPVSVADNLQLAIEVGDAETRRAAPEPGAMLELVGLDGSYAPRTAAELSAGERQRVAIARALMTAPDVLLLDEPTSNLDPEVARCVLTNLRRLVEQRGMALVFITHRLSEARLMSTQTVMLEGGHVVEIGPTTRLFAAARSERARSYLGCEGEPPKG
jgi:putative ABC transport system ATP-binding protein